MTNRSIKVKCGICYVVCGHCIHYKRSLWSPVRAESKKIGARDLLVTVHFELGQALDDIIQLEASSWTPFQKREEGLPLTRIRKIQEKLMATHFDSDNNTNFFPTHPASSDGFLKRPSRH